MAQNPRPITFEDTLKVAVRLLDIFVQNAGQQPSAPKPPAPAPKYRVLPTNDATSRNTKPRMKPPTDHPNS